jgi:REP element-mobilizing transposase RayT
MPLFRAFDPHAPVTVYRRNLPHWRQAGCTYFVTFRLADSIPAPVLRQWSDERRTWMSGHGIDGSLREALNMKKYLAIPASERLLFERTQHRRLQLHLDRCQGSCCLEHKTVQEHVRTALHYFDGDRWQCGDWVIMPNHVHLLCVPAAGWELEDLLQSIKRFTATRSGTSGQTSLGRMWQRESYDRIVRNRRELAVLRQYIADNPMKARVRADRFACYRTDWLIAE